MTHRPQRFLVAPDSFKGTFDAPTVTAAIAAGIEEGGGMADPCPLADGGEGTMDVLLAALGGERRSLTVHDPLRRPVEASFALLGDDRTAVVEMAQASGLPLLAPEERDPERADTYGTGELIAAALAAGAKEVLLAAGGSATVDGGRGAIEALREAGHDDASSVVVLCDVTTPFEDAARIFGPQKGADADAVARLSAALEAYALELPRDPRGMPMSGAAGGLSGGLWAWGAELRLGAEHVLGAVSFDRRLAEADAAVTGEGRFDSQSLEGKVVGAVAERCAASGKGLHLVVGQAGLGSPPPAVISSLDEAGAPEEMRRVGVRLASGASRSW
jgi:glycerate 2-kinase